jgi:DNA polymerase-1
MSENILVFNINENVKNAFDSMPAFTDENGKYLSGVYGAFFKLNSVIKSGEFSAVKFLSDENEEGISPSVLGQISDFKERISAISDSSTAPVNDSFLAAVNNELLKLSPSGEVKSAATFDFKEKITSDLTEVEDIFKKALAYGSGGAENYVSYYLLTDNVSNKDSKKKEFLGISVCYDKENSYFIPFENFITADYIGKKLYELSKAVSLVTFDIKDSFRLFEPNEIADRTFGYSAKSLSEENETIYSEDDSYKSNPRCFDVLIGAYLLNPIKNDYLPEDIAKEFCKLTLPKRADALGKESIALADTKILSGYCCKVSYTCLLAAPLIRKQLVKSGMENLFYTVEMPLSYILYSMEKEGIIARRDELKAYGDKLQVRIEELEKLIYEAAGCEFNINSPKQLGEILFERLGLPAEKKTKSGYSTAAEVLEKLAPEHKIVADILEYRGLSKLKSTYADGLANFIEDDGRIHTSFNQTITATGRISSTEPNLQNIPMRTDLGRLIRKVFVPKEGFCFADADYSQIELRILAHLSGDKGLISAYREGKDIHRITASKVFHVPFEEVTSLQRRNAKAVNFGIVYGISAFGLSQDLSIPVGEAKDYMEKYFETYPGVRIYQDKSIKEAKEKGYSLTMYGRRRPIPELKSGIYNLRQFGERVAMNAPIQGSAADIMKIAMINVFFALKKEGLKSKLILQIHDELVIETADDEVDTVKALLTREMERAVSMSVPMEAECNIGSDWYEAK